MISDYFSQFSLLSFSIFLGSILFFAIGYTLAPTVYYKKISWLLAYPMWMANKLEEMMKKKWRPLTLFIFIFSLNSVSLSIDFVSGWVPFLPILFAIWTGLNVGLITYHTLEGEFFYIAILNPVALLELPAAFITFTMAFQYNLKILQIPFSTSDSASIAAYFHFYLIVVLPLLFIAAILETWLIFHSKKKEEQL